MWYPQNVETSLLCLVVGLLGSGSCPAVRQVRLCVALFAICRRAAAAVRVCVCARSSNASERCMPEPGPVNSGDGSSEAAEYQCAVQCMPGA